MTVLAHEWKSERKALLIWSLAIGIMLAISIFLYPEMKSQVDELSEMMAQMGSFSSAFGMDRINFGTITGYFAVECGNMLGIGGALFAAILGVSSLAKEEKEHTAEWLLTHPITRTRVVFEKLIAAVVQVTVLNGICIVIALGAFAIIGERPDAKTLFLLFLAYYLLQLIITAITFGVSAFLRGNGLGIGIGLALLLYFVNVIANITDEAKVLKYVTPFSFAEGADIITNGALEMRYLVVGLAAAAAAIAAAFVRYSRKDIAA